MADLSTYSNAELQKIAGQTADMSGYSDEELMRIAEGQDDLSSVSDAELYSAAGITPDVAPEAAQPPVTPDMRQFAEAYRQPESVFTAPGEDIAVRQELGAPIVPRGTSEIGKAWERGKKQAGAAIGRGIEYVGEELKQRERPMQRMTVGGKVFTAPMTGPIPGEAVIEAGVGVTEHYEDILAKHPEWQPSPEFMDRPWHDPERLAATVVETIPLTGAAMGSGIIAGAVTRNPYVGAVVGGAVFGTVSAGDILKEGLTMGLTKEDALNAARIAGAGEAALEFIPGYMFMKMAGIGQPLTRKLVKEGVKEVNRAIRVAYGMGKIGVAESLEEGTQTMKDNLVVRGYWDPDKPIFQDVPESAAVGGIMGVGLGGVASGLSLTQRRQMIQDIRKEIVALPEIQLPSEQKDQIIADLGRQEEELAAGVRKAEARYAPEVDEVAPRLDEVAPQVVEEAKDMTTYTDAELAKVAGVELEPITPEAKSPQVIAKQYNLKYAGEQEFPGREPLHLFTLKDKGAESTFPVESLDPKVVEAKIKEVRERFGVKEVEAELGKKVDVKIGDVTPKPGLVVKEVKETPKVEKPVTYKFEDKEAETRFKAAQGIPKEPLRKKAMEALITLKHKTTRDIYEHLPITKEFAQLRFNLHKLAKQRGVASDRTLRAVQGVTIDLNKGQFDLFRRKVILDDLTEVAEKGKALPFGFTVESLAKEKYKLDNVISKDADIQTSIKDRTNLWDGIKEDYTSSMKDIGFDVSERLKNKNYFRHQVIEYANLKSQYGTGRKLKTPTSRGFLRKRKGSELDINTDYIQAEYEVMAQMMYDVEVAKTISDIEAKYNISEKVRAEAKEQKLDDWHDAIPEGYQAWQPREGHVFFMANSIPAKLADKLQAGVLQKLGLTAEDIRQIYARGGKFREFVVKDEIADTLNNLTREPSNSLIAIIDKKVLRAWKVWTLISPRRFFKYNARNVTGDADAVFVGNPKAFLKMPQAVAELYNTMFGDKAMTPMLKSWFERGGFETTLQAQEMGELNKLKMFVHLHEKKGTLAKTPVRVWQGYWKAARLSTDFREAILRYAAYIDYVEQLKASPKGKPKNFGASVPEEIMGLDSVEDKAFWLANDLLGAYDRISVAGHDLRDHLFPFWSWQEVNFKRYIQFWKNAWNDNRTTEVVGRKVVTTAIKSPLVAMRIGKLMLKATALWSMLQAWNWSMFPDEEEELPDEQKHRPHLILGRDEDGKILVFYRLGAVGSFLEWFGLDAAPKHVNDWFKGKRSLNEIAKDMAKSPANIIAQGATPMIKIPVEIMTRRSLFPDMFRPGTVRDRGYHIARGFGVQDEYKAVLGLPSKGYEKSLYNFLYYKSDPLQSAYHAIFEEKNRFLKKMGKGREGFMLSPRGDALYNFKLSIRYKDQVAAKKYLTEYVALGGSAKGIVTSMKNMHPLTGLNQIERAAFYKTLDSEDRQKLTKAVRFYNEVLKGE